VSIEKRETAAHMNNRYSESERAAIYRVIRERRDIPTGYLPEPIEDQPFQFLETPPHTA